MNLTPQTFGFRLFGNMCDMDMGIKLIVDESVYLCLISTLQQPQYMNNPVVMVRFLICLISHIVFNRF